MEQLMAAQQQAQLARLAAAEAAAAAGGVVGDSDSVAHLQQQVAAGIDLQHAASFASALGSPTTAHQLLLGNLAAAHHSAELDAVAAAAAAAAAAAGTGSAGGGSSRDQGGGQQRGGGGRRRGHAAATMEATGTSRGVDSDDERVRRRREINRNSQKRIRERRTKEMDGLKSEVGGGGLCGGGEGYIYVEEGVLAATKGGGGAGGVAGGVLLGCLLNRS